MGYDRYGRKLKRKNKWLALPVVLWAGVTIAPIVAGAVCSKLVPHTTVTKVKNRVTKHTADAWAKWREAHPGWKPNPKVVRPKYIMTTKEAMEKVDFACQVTLLDVEPPQIELATLEPPTIDIPFTEAPPDLPLTPQVATTDDTPPTMVTPPLFAVVGPPPVTLTVPPPVMGQTPEPDSLLLVGTAGVMLLLFSRRRLLNN